ncbi:DUF499 domain-containing protein [Aureimonas leprariae]|uniref:ATP-binding protein n=1 Tax=Plantimonas leprariae TaxID=2615207 RepID=A0A7V7TVG5_9HYPH|nr:DUF499 domain-containing protein [Aureimonas leprariae]KAB0678450.1 ATP-binding protein [Aureimonas leprariae]
MSNREAIGDLLERVERVGRPYVEMALKGSLGANWRATARLPNTLSPVSELDPHAVLYAVIHNWREVFAATLKPEARDAASAVFAGRNTYSHSAGAIDDMLALRALSGGVDFLRAIGAKGEADGVQAHLVALMGRMAPPQPKPTAPEAGGTAAGATGDRAAAVRAGILPKPSGLILTAPKAPPEKPTQDDFFAGGDVEGLRPWRIVSPPQDDVLEGRLDKDRFAANLAAADRGEGGDTYANGDSFFKATHLTAGLALTLENAARRLSGQGGPSTVGLQTNFGGGKTHTLMSLLHMARLADWSRVDNLGSVAARIGRSSLGEVNAAVFSGSDKGPSEPLAVADGAAVRTLWGYLAWRIAGREGMQLVERSELSGESPGAEAFGRVLRLTGRPSLILLDELVVFVRQLSGERYDSHISFLQSLTEAAAQVPNALIVGSLPESDLEAGGTEKGKDTLRALEKLFGRTQSAWQPAQGAETYSVVRRRLFQELDETGERERRKTVERFRKLYRENKSDFPVGAGDADYADKMTEAYPVHPMLFDKLSNDWGILEKFQRTRGVLSLLARTIYASYREASNEPLILPSSLQMGDPQVRGGLIEPLEGPTWGTIVESEVDGDGSLPADMEARRPRYRNDQVARRAARAVFMASAPMASERGAITAPELRLACVRPNEQISIFGDALRELAERSAHLYEADGRYWFGPKPTLNKLAENRQLDIDDDRANEEIVRLLAAERRSGGWGGVHPCPASATDVEDTPTSRLVILRPATPYASGGSSPAEIEAQNAVQRRAGGQRKYRNALVFLAPDARLLDDCRRAVKRKLAWESIAADAALELVASQRRDAESRRDQAARVALESIRKCWQHILVPSQTPGGGAEIVLDPKLLRPTGQKTPSEAAWDRVVEEGDVAKALGAAVFADRILELWPAGQAHLPVDQVRDWYFEFLHMERLQDEVTLANAVAASIADMDTGRSPFALASGRSEAGYENLQFARAVQVRFGAGLLLVRRSELPAAGETPSASVVIGSPAGGASGAPVGRGGDQSAATKPIPKRYNGVFELDAVRGGIKASQIFESIVAELDRAAGARFRIVLEVHAETEAGFDERLCDDVSANAATLGFSRSDFSS